MARKTAFVPDVRAFLAKKVVVCRKAVRSCNASGCTGCEHQKGHRDQCWCVCSTVGRR